jgi:hypothetical protein
MKKSIVTVALLISLLFADAQDNVGIGTTTPNSKALLDMDATDKGFLLPRLTTAQRNTLGATLTVNEDGLIVYDKNDKLFYFWDGLAWIPYPQGIDTDQQTLTVVGNSLVLSSGSSGGGGTVPLPAGPQGPIGNNGAVGLVGPIGPIGLTGNAGPNGVQGPIGNNGAVGLDGPIGPIGLTGNAGPIGVQGPIGNNGAVGLDGPIGPIGLTGNAGPIGVQGPIGNNGAVGLDGPIGPIGLTGNAGPIGVQGPVGNNGAVGLVGPIGPIGLIGPVGTAGIQGLPGITGPPGLQGNPTTIVAGPGLTGGGTGASVTLNADANNGLNVDAAADRIQLGGPLIRNTTISQAAFNFNIDLTGTGDFNISDNGASKFFVRDDGFIGLGLTAPLTYFHSNQTNPANNFHFLLDNQVVGNDAVLRGQNLSPTNGNRTILGVTTYTGSAFAATGVEGLSLGNIGSGVGLRGFSNSLDGTGVEAGFIGGTNPAALGWALFSDGWAGGTTPWLNVSDARLKENVNTISNALDLVLRLRGVTYDFKEDNFANLNVSGQQIGFIAQEVEEVLPEIVRTTSVKASSGKANADLSVPAEYSDIKALSYSSIIPVLVEAMKEQQALINQLTERLKVLEAQ